MKLLVVFAVAIVAASGASDQDLWAEFKQTYGRAYRSLREEKLRFNIFQNTLRKIEEHNARYENGEETYFLKVTIFADKTLEEFQQLLGRSKANKPEIKGSLHVPPVNFTAPDSVDWRQKGAVMEVKNQGQCGSCWAFSATGAIEGQNAIKHGKKMSLSEQNLLDCSSSYGNGDCQAGGDMVAAFRYVHDHGIESESDYPYRAIKTTCRFVASKSVVKVSGYRNVQSNENALTNAVASVGPISVGIDADHLSAYGGGIFTDNKCSARNINHGVLVVGYGRQNNVDYWIVKNSWGQAWGENGYFRIKRNANNLCGIASDASYPLL